MSRVGGSLPNRAPLGWIWRLGWRSGLVETGYTNTRRQGLGFGWAIGPLLAWRAHGSDDLSAKLMRHLGRFSASFHLSGIALGAVARIEAENKGAESVLFKQRLSGPSHVFGDRIFQQHLKPLLLALCLIAIIAANWQPSESAFILGAGFVIFGASTWWARLAGVAWGWHHGARAPYRIARWPIKRWLAPLGWGGAIAAGLLLTASIFGYHVDFGRPVSLSAIIVAIISAALGKRLPHFLLYLIAWGVGFIAMIAG